MNKTTEGGVLVSTIKAGDRVVRRATGEHGTVTAILHAVERRPRMGRFYGDDLGEQGYVHIGEFDAEGAEEWDDDVWVVWVRPGDEIDANHRVVEVDYVAKTITVEPKPASEADVAPSRTYVSKGGGYYDLLEDGAVVDSVRGKAKAEAWVDA